MKCDASPSSKRVARSLPSKKVMRHTNPCVYRASEQVSEHLALAHYPASLPSLPSTPRIWPCTLGFYCRTYSRLSQSQIQHESNEPVYSLHHLVSYTLWDCHIASIHSICNWIFCHILFAVCAPFPWLLQPLPLLLLLLLPVLCFGPACAYVLENGYWFFPRFWWRQRNEDTSIGPEWFAPLFYWIAWCVSPAQIELETCTLGTFPSVLRQCKWQIIYLM